MRLLLLLVLLGCLSATWAHRFSGRPTNREPQPESEDNDDSEEEGDSSSPSSQEDNNSDARRDLKKQWWNKLLRNKTEPLLRLINQTYHKMLTLPPPDKDASTNNWIVRTKLVKEYVHEGKKILFGDWHHRHHWHHHKKGESDGIDWTQVGHLVAGILNRLDEKDDMKKVLGNKLDPKSLAEFYKNHSMDSKDKKEHQHLHYHHHQHMGKKAYHKKGSFN